MMNYHYTVIHKNCEGRYNLLYSDTDRLVYSIQHEDIYEWMKDNKQYYDLSESLGPDLHGNTNKKSTKKVKDEANSLLITEFTALNPKVYSFLYQSIDEFNNVEIKNKKASAKRRSSNNCKERNNQ